MAKIKVANFTFIKEERFVLPSVTQSPNENPHINGRNQFDFDLPADARSRGILSFIMNAQKGEENEVDVEFEVHLGSTTHSWSFNRSEYACIQYPVHGLEPGNNIIVFKMNKGGKVTIPNPDETLGGKGIVLFSQVCLHYHRDVEI